jgi:outer membrane protein TolC
LYTGVFCPYAASAQTTLALDRALELALENNLSLKKSLIDIASAEYSASHLWWEIFPSISVSASVTLLPQTPLFSGEFNYNTDASFFNTSVGINFNFNAGIPFSLRNITLAYQKSLLDFEDAQKQIIIRITKSFFSLLTEKNNLDYLEDILSLAQRQFDKNQVSFNNGLISQLSLMQSRLGVETARYNLAVARTSYSNNMVEFLASLGLPPDEGIALSGEYSVVRIEAQAEALINEHLPKRPDIVGRRREIERLTNVQRQTELSNRAPSLSLSASWRISNFDPFTDNVSASASFSIPVNPWIPGTQQNQNISNAARNLEKAVLDLQIAEDSARTQIRSLTAGLRNSWNSLEIARLSLGVAERSYQISEAGFNNGTVESLALEEARNSLANARQRLLQSELSYFNMTLDLCSALNIGLNELIEKYGAM